MPLHQREAAATPPPLLGRSIHIARMQDVVPFVNAPGTMIDVSMPQRASSPAYETASESIAAFAAKYGER